MVPRHPHGRQQGPPGVRLILLRVEALHLCKISAFAMPPEDVDAAASCRRSTTVTGVHEGRQLLPALQDRIVALDVLEGLPAKCGAAKDIDEATVGHGRALESGCGHGVQELPPAESRIVALRLAQNAPIAEAAEDVDEAPGRGCRSMSVGTTDWRQELPSARAWVVALRQIPRVIWELLLAAALPHILRDCGRLLAQGWFAEEASETGQVNPAYDVEPPASGRDGARPARQTHGRHFLPLPCPLAESRNSVEGDSAAPTTCVDAGALVQQGHSRK
mmetsp:Transcript_122808/g.274180  ORF Transcript_122808/g.274180 Transcript_122808/m.274180 type:complete len:276 (+) Transcript_122808:291-1118(+)